MSIRVWVSCVYTYHVGWTSRSLLLSPSPLEHDTTTTMLCPCSEKSASPQEGRGQAPQAFRRGEHMGRVGFDPVVFSPGMAGHPCLILRATSVSSKEHRRISERDCLCSQGVRRSVRDPRGSGDRFGIPGGPEIGLGSRPQGVRRSVWDPKTSRERTGDFDGPETVVVLASIFCAEQLLALSRGFGIPN